MFKYHKFYFLFLLSIIFLVNSCDEEPPIPQDTFVKIYVDLLILQDSTAVEKFSVDSAKVIVFKKYNISTATYESTIDYYNSEPERWIGFFDSAGAYIERLKLSAENQL